MKLKIKITGQNVHNVGYRYFLMSSAGTVSKASEKRIFRDLLSRLIDQIEEPAPGFA
jgi:hypothetical protein